MVDNRRVDDDGVDVRTVKKEKKNLLEKSFNDVILINLK